MFWVYMNHLQSFASKMSGYVEFHKHSPFRRCDVYTPVRTWDPYPPRKVTQTTIFFPCLHYSISSAVYDFELKYEDSREPNFLTTKGNSFSFRQQRSERKRDEKKFRPFYSRQTKTALNWEVSIQNSFYKYQCLIYSLKLISNV